MSPLTLESLASQPPLVQRMNLYKHLYRAVIRLQPDLAGKITAMILETTNQNQEILMIIASSELLRQRVNEAMRLLNQGRPQQPAA
mmetsp:Transcript_139026/g.443964  ORF Transcript_139026/g.443964 Transcript_139026/m.443964 type:complete len:86 (-) Transcript_139026:278-535(-)